MKILEPIRHARSLLLFAACATACTADTSAPLVATDLVVTQALPGVMMSAGYVTLTNNSAEIISLTSVSSPQFASVEIHETIIANDIARMRPVEKLVIAPGQTVKLEPGAKHLMLMQAQESTDKKAVDLITLNFYADNLLVLSVSTTLGS